MIVSGSSDKTVRVWRVPQKLYNFERLGNLRPVLEVLKFLSPEEVVGIARVNKRFYEASFHSEVQKPVFKQTKVLRGHTGGIWSVAVSESRNMLVSGSVDNTVRVWNLATGEVTQVLTGHSKGVSCVAISAKEQSMASGSIDNNLKLWSLSTLKQTLVLEGHSASGNLE